MRDTMRIAGTTHPVRLADSIDRQDYAIWQAAADTYIYRSTRLGVEAGRGRALPFVAEVSRVLFGGTVQNWPEGTHLADAATRAGLDLAAMDAAVAADPASYDATIAENQRDLEAAGHWGVPTMVFENEPFFGQDRLDLLVWRLQQHGLRRRAG
jgi:2-hydroxychromene-2-carboxylate isomerase